MEEAVRPGNGTCRSWLWSPGALLAAMSILVQRSHLQQNCWKHVFDYLFIFSVAVIAKGISLISLAECSEPALEEGDSCITHL